MRLRAAWCVLSLIPLAGCDAGDVARSDGEPDAVDATAPVDVPPEDAPSPDRVAPVPGADGALAVTGLTDTSLTLTWGAASDDVTAASELTYRVARSATHELATLEDVAAYGTVVAELTGELTVSVADLASGTRCYLGVVVSDAAGNARAYGGADVRVPFAKVEVMRKVTWSEGKPSVYADHAFDERGLLRRVTRFNGSGHDHAWFTADDEVVTYTHYQYEAGVQPSAETTYAGVGRDGAWFTDDDVADHVTRWERDANGHVTRQTLLLGDGQDGEIREIQELVYDDGGHPTLSVRWVSPGADGVWSTPDDQAADAQRATYTERGAQESLTLFGPGADGLWLTADDAPWFLSTLTYDPSGRLSEVVEASGAGADGVWATADDLLADVTTYTREDAGDLTRTTRATRTGPGADGAWKTADDPLATVVVTDTDAAGHELLTVYYDDYVSLGDDGTLGTSDDVPAATTRRTYRDDGRPVDEVHTSGPGPDGAWLTEDDLVRTYTEYTYDARGTLVRREDFLAGANGIRHDADDLPKVTLELAAIYTLEPSPVLTER